MADGTCARRLELQKRLQDSQKSAAFTFANLNKELRRISECLDRLEGQPARINGESGDRRAPPPPRSLPIVNQLLGDGETPPQAPAINNLSGTSNSSGVQNTTGSGSRYSSSQITSGRYSPLSLFSTPPAGKNGINCNSRNEEIYPFNFDGSGNVLEWISQCEQYFYFENTAAYNRTIAASMFLEGNALRWYESYRKSTGNWSCWLEFCAQLSHRFEVVPDDRARVENIQEAAEMNIEYHDLVNGEDMISENVDKEPLSISQDCKNTSPNDVNEVLDVDGVCNREEIIGTGMTSEKLGAEKFNGMCILKDKDHDFVQEHIQIEELETLSLLNDEVHSLRDCNKNSVVDFIVQGAEIGTLPLINVKETYLRTYGKCVAVYDDGVKGVKQIQLDCSHDEFLAQLNFGKMIMGSARSIKDEVLRDFKRYKKKVEQVQKAWFQVLKVLCFFLFARSKWCASWFWLCVDGNLLVCSLKVVCLLVLAECNVFVVLGTDYSRGPDALLQAQMSHRERIKNELIVGVMANLKLLPFKQTPLIQRRAHKLSLMLAGLVLVVERFGKVVFKLKPPYGVENQECLSHLLKKKLDNGEVAVAFVFSDTWIDETSLFTSELILVRKVKNCGSCEADDATWKEHKFFDSNSFISSLRSRMVFRGGVVDTSQF